MKLTTDFEKEKANQIKSDNFIKSIEKSQIYNHNIRKMYNCLSP